MSSTSPSPPPSGRSLSLATRAAEWLRWVGLARLVTSAVATVVVALGAFWLLRSPPPPIEAGLPVATTAPGDRTQDGSTTAPAVSTATTTPPLRPVVHVTGAVREPGVYELPAGARIREAIAAAGGATADAVDHALNLAAPVVDGSRIQVPAVGEELEVVIEQPPTATTSSGSDASPGAPVDVNRAGTVELEQLPGVGPATAAAIVDDRTRNGPFLTVDDLDRVAGIGPAKLDALRDLVTT